MVNYAQWASEDAFRAAMGRADVRAHMGEIAAAAESFDPTLTTVRSVHRRADARV